MKYQNLIINCEKDPNLHHQFAALIDLLPTMPALKKLIDEATANGPVTVNFVKRHEIHTSGNCERKGWIKGNYKRSEVTINIVHEGRTLAQMLDTLIFELHNAKNPYFQLFDDKEITPKKYLDAESYAKAVEYAEFAHTHVPSRKLVKELFSDPTVVAAFKAKGLSFSRDDIRYLTAQVSTSFDEWWRSVNKPIKGRSYSHCDVYREHWEKWAARHGVRPVKPVVAKAVAPALVPPQATPAAKVPAPPPPKPRAAQARIPAPAMPRAPMPNPDQLRQPVKGFYVMRRELKDRQPVLIVVAQVQLPHRHHHGHRGHAKRNKI